MRTGWQAAGVAAIVALVGLGVAAAGETPQKTPQKWTEESGISMPKLIERVDPVYPEEARAQRVQGIVKVEATLGTDGVVQAVRTSESPDERLAAAALAAVAKWRFEPARTPDGKAVAVLFTVTVNFKLK